MIERYEVKLDGFAGPLDLLLHLINQLEVDIYDIPVAEITEQYIDYIQQMKFLELNIASEYLVMAATLIELKSKMLLPTEEVIMGGEEYEEDPREKLREKLLQYRQFKQAAHSLQENEGNLMYTRARLELKNDESDRISQNENGGVTVYDMLGALSSMLKRKEWNEPLETRIERMELSVDERMGEMIQILYNHPNGVSFDDMFIYQDKGHIVTTFMALLELMRNSEIYCVQKKHFANIIIYLNNENVQ